MAQLTECALGGTLVELPQCGDGLILAHSRCAQTVWLTSNSCRKFCSS